jgi:hypothetical protein
MRGTIDMAREAGIIHPEMVLNTLKAFEALVRADERNSWPAEMEAMERQVNILTDALAAEREACAEFVEDGYVRQFERPWREDLAAAIRARVES